MKLSKPDPNKGGPIQMGFFTPTSDWRPREISSLPSFDGIDRIALDCETKDIYLRDLGPGPRRGAYTTGWGVALEAGDKLVDKFYLPIRHEGGDNLPVEEVLGYLRDNLKNYRGDVVGANLSYDLDYAANDEIIFHRDCKFRDIQIADPLIYELHFSYSLENIGKRWGVKGKEVTVLHDAAKSMGLDPGSGMWRLPARFVGEYAENDVTAPLDIYAKQRKILDRDDLWQIFDLETSVLPVLVKMRRRGIRIDFNKLEEIEQESMHQEITNLEFIKAKTGVHIPVGDVWKAKMLAPALEYMGVQLQRTKTGAPQIDAKMLENLNHPVARAISNARKLNKIRTTFAASIRRYATDGRIHCNFQQIAQETEDGKKKGVRYGRLSATDPNLQQQYSPDKVRPEDPQLILEWRKIFQPEEGAIWGTNDFSQQEPRWTTHFAAKMGLPKAEEAAKRYRDDATADNHDMMARLIHGDAQVDEWLANDKDAYKRNRTYAKIIFLGLCYGEGEGKLCVDLILPTRWALVKGREYTYFDTQHEAFASRAASGQGIVRMVAGKEGQKILDGFSENVPFVKKIARAATKRAESVGHVKTIMNRRLHFLQKDDGSYDWTHKALNRVIQGSSADQMKKALVDLDNEGHFIQLQVHDDVNGSYEDVKQAEKAGEIMRDSILGVCTPLVPFNVDTETGSDWGSVK